MYNCYSYFCEPLKQLGEKRNSNITPRKTVVCVCVGGGTYYGRVSFISKEGGLYIFGGLVNGGAYFIKNLLYSNYRGQ